MAKVNVARKPVKVKTHEGGPAIKVAPYLELKRTVMSCLLFEDTFYEGKNAIAERIHDLCQSPQITPDEIAEMAIEARSKMYLRHAPLWLMVSLLDRAVKQPASKGHEPRLRFTKFSGIREVLPRVIQRADELAEFIAMYWKDKRRKLPWQVKQGLREAFAKFDAYQLAKYSRDSQVTLRDVMFLTHPNPGKSATLRHGLPNAEGDFQRERESRAALYKQLAENTLKQSGTWEDELSAGKDKKATFETLLKENKLGGLATLRNLRNMEQVNVDRALVLNRLNGRFDRVLPFRFLAAARHAPTFAAAIETAMLRAIESMEKMPGETGILIDVSGSMDVKISDRSELNRIEVAGALAVLLRELCGNVLVATFSDRVVSVKPNRGFALIEEISRSQMHSGTQLGHALDVLRTRPGWKGLNRMIVITDEQAHDHAARVNAWAPNSYLINVAPYQYGVGYKHGWTHIDGFSERVIEYIQLYEKEDLKDAYALETAD